MHKRGRCWQSVGPEYGRGSGHFIFVGTVAVAPAPEPGKGHEGEIVGIHGGAVWNKVVQQDHLDALLM